VHAHEESVLGLYLSEDGNLLFSSGGDSVVNVSLSNDKMHGTKLIPSEQVWSTRTFERLYSIYSHHDVGDIFSVVYSSSNQTIYCGAQNTSIQVRSLPSIEFPQSNLNASGATCQRRAR
jgi:di- and tripeptidase